MTSAPYVRNLTSTDDFNLRCWFFVEWTLIIDVPSWLVWSKGHHSAIVLAALCLVMILGPLLGWQLGYKHGFAGLFRGFIVKNEPSSEEGQDKVESDSSI